MLKTLMLIAGAALTALAPAPPVASASPAPPVAPLGEEEQAEFEELSIILERNETDGDAEIVVEATATHGLRWLKVRHEGKGRPLFTVRTRDEVGLREFLLESAEPSLAEVLAAFPEGVYEFQGRTIDGELIEGTAELSHASLPSPVLGTSVGADVVVSWSSVAGAAGYLVEVENDDLGVNLTAQVAGDATGFTVPADFLLPDTEYEIGVATITDNGNIAFAESSFTTLP